MRIIAGTKRGMRLLSPKTQESRPITDRVKESLFSVLYKYGLPDGNPAPETVQGKMVADLFCGVGSLGLEALSRGAGFVTFVEQDPKIIAVLEKNVEKAGFAGESKIIRANAFKIALNQKRFRVGASINEQKYDLIFVDPPYAATREIKAGSPHSGIPLHQERYRVPHVVSHLSGLLILLSEQLSPNGIVVVRTHRRTFLLEEYGQLQIVERRQWGTMAVTLYQSGTG